MAKVKTVKSGKRYVETVTGMVEYNEFFGYKPAYYYPNRLFSFDINKFYFYIAIGSRGRGKTVSAWRWVLKRFKNYGEKFVWLRLTEAPLKKMKQNKGRTVIPSGLIKKLGYDGIDMKGNIIYLIKTEKMKTTMMECGVIDAISTYYSSKGNTFENYTNIVFDEINRETSERNTFDIMRGFINSIENVARMRKMRVLMLGNTITDTSDILSIFNFSPKPGKFGIYKLTRRYCIIEYMDDSEEFKEMRKNSLAGKLLEGNESMASSFTNIAVETSDNVTKRTNSHRLMFVLYMDSVLNYGIYETMSKKNKGKLFIGYVVGNSKNKYKISPYLNCEGIYDKEIHKMLEETIATNNMMFETVLVRSRFIKALKMNKTILQ